MSDLFWGSTRRHWVTSHIQLLGATLFLGLAAPVELLAFQSTQAPELTADQRQAVETITQGKLLSTVSFLASDEMAGRQTPSKELTIASAYVAARFRGAGLEGLGPDGSFYQTHFLDSVQIPAEGAVLSLNGDESKARLKLLAAKAESVAVTSKVLSEEDALSRDNPAICVIEEFSVPPQGAANPGVVVSMLARRIRPLAAKGVQVVLVRTAPDSLLWETADALSDKPSVKRNALNPACCVALIRKDDVPADEVTIEVPELKTIRSPVRNVVGVLRGADESLAKEAILVSAHLDHIGIRGEGPDVINNGADDNATGVTAVLAIADAFASMESPPPRSVIFMTFWGEEKGLLGSKEFVKEPLWPLTELVANINIEMVGRPEKDAVGKAWMTGWKHSNLGDVMHSGAGRAGVEIFDRKDVGEMLYRRSDNFSFVQRGVIAHSFSAGSLHSDYHQPTDEWDKLDLVHMTQVVRGLFAGTLEVARIERSQLKASD